MLISSTTKRAYGTFEDRRDAFDDTTELQVFRSYLKTHYGASYTIVDKPYGMYAVDVGVFTATGQLHAAFDLERCKAWGADWPAYWKSLSFLARKDTYLQQYDTFGMVWFNHALTKFVLAWKDDILRFPVIQRTFARATYHDWVRAVEFNCGTLFGSDFGVRERSCFSSRVEWITHTAHCTAV